MSGASFINVDLDIYSARDLQPLINAFGTKVHTLFAGKVRRKFCAHLEVAREAKSADSVIKVFCRLIDALPQAERKIWDAATMRSFSVGILSGMEPSARDFVIKQYTVKAVAIVNAEIVITVYAPGAYGE